MSNVIDNATLQKLRHVFSINANDGSRQKGAIDFALPARSSCREYDAAMNAQRATVAAFLNLLETNPEQAADFAESIEGVIRNLGIFHGLKLPAPIQGRK